MARYNPPMLLQAIDALHVAADPAPYERLGLRSSAIASGPPIVRIGHGTNAVRIVFLAVGNAGISTIGIRVANLRAAVEHLSARGLLSNVHRSGDFAWLPIRDRTGADLMVTQGSAATPAHNPARLFPLKRLDHLAAVAHDLDGTCRFWADVLGVPVIGEVRTPTMIIRQLRIGDAIFELLGPAGPNSPLHQRPARLVSMAAWEVDDLSAAVAQARAAGFTVSDPAVGVLPGTRTATIPAADLGGVAMQLLEYV
jgi:catechol 2,3-dioxygenase-like lactoylglutathione lyase family enzyme